MLPSQKFVFLINTFKAKAQEYNFLLIMEVKMNFFSMLALIRKILFYSNTTHTCADILIVTPQSPHSTWGNLEKW